MKISRMVVDRERSAGKVSAAARTHSTKVNEGVTKLLGVEMGAAAEQMMIRSADTLDEKTRAMVAADEANIAELDDDAPKREAKDAAAADTRGVIVNLREVTTTVLGGGYVEALGFQGETPEDAVMLARLAERIVERVDATPLPPARFEGMAFDPAPWKAKLQGTLSRLTGAIEGVNIESREAEQTLAAKNAAIADYDDVFNKTAGLVSALLRFAGEEDLADRVKPIRSKPGQIADPEVSVDESGEGSATQ